MMLKGKSALVTGGAAGIGLATSERLASEGATVMIADIDRSAGEAAAARLREDGGQAHFLHSDMGSVPSINDMVAAAIELVGRLDILVNNAGVSKRIGILEIDEASWDWMQSINTKGLFFCLQRVAAHMKEAGGGRIVNMASIAGKGAKGTSNACYAASKAAAINIARVAAAELGPFGINVNAVCPGPTRTELMDRLEAANPAIISAMVEASALRRMSTPADIADVTLFLCSDLARNVTGQSINVDAGIMWD
ncbi:glucose 1-dehydrogenase [Micromonospora sp. STR1s_5]|nr:glucose 1-dehydrogenase [Micromonospora sp. STR1s_5]